MEKEMLENLRRIPDDVILAMASRDIEPSNAFKCVCGWAARELHSKLNGTDADNNTGEIFVTEYLAEQLGGNWLDINGAFTTTDSLDALEKAFTDRVSEVVS